MAEVSVCDHSAQLCEQQLCLLIDYRKHLIVSGTPEICLYTLSRPLCMSVMKWLAVLKCTSTYH